MTLVTVEQDASWVMKELAGPSTRAINELYQARDILAPGERIGWKMFNDSF